MSPYLSMLNMLGLCKSSVVVLHIKTVFPNAISFPPTSLSLFGLKIQPFIFIKLILQINEVSFIEHLHKMFLHPTIRDSENT